MDDRTKVWYLSVEEVGVDVFTNAVFKSDGVAV